MHLQHIHTDGQSRSYSNPCARRRACTVIFALSELLSVAGWLAGWRGSSVEQSGVELGSVMSGQMGSVEDVLVYSALP